MGNERIRRSRRADTSFTGRMEISTVLEEIQGNETLTTIENNNQKLENLEASSIRTQLVKPSQTSTEMQI